MSRPGRQVRQPDLSLAINATVPISRPAHPLTLTGSLLVSMFCKVQCSTWTAPRRRAQRRPSTAAWAIDPTTLEINSLAADFNYSGTNVVSGSLQNCPVCTYLGVNGYLNMHTAVAVDAACHYEALTGLVADASSTLDVDRSSTLSNGSINLSRPSSVPLILQWGLSGTINGTFTQGLHATVPVDGQPQWTAPFTTHLTCKLTGNTPIAIYLQALLGWDMSKPHVVDYSADLANLTF